MEYDTRQVAEHKAAQDAWMTIHGKVYDVTRYLQHHPGGPDLLAEAAGTDASEAFDSAGHSEDAFETMHTFHIGALKGYKKKPKRKAVAVAVAVAVAAATSSAQQPTQAADGRANKTQQSLVSGLAKAGLFSLIATSFYYACHRHGPATPKWLLSLVDSKMAPSRHGHGFATGLLAGIGIFALVGTLLARHLAHLIFEIKSFTSYPAHMRLPDPVQEDMLLQRGLLDPATYSRLPLKAKVKLSPNVYRFTFNLPTTETLLGLPIGQHVAIKAEITGESVSRSYTPVSNNADRGVLELVIKVYPDGKLTSQYLSQLAVGDEILFRGPKGAMRYTPGWATRIGMVAGGTGITPMFQVIRAVCEHDRDLTQISLVYANRTEQDILLRKELDAFARRYPRQFSVFYLLDQPPEDWAYGQGHCTQPLMQEKLPGPRLDTKMMICGPPGMVSAAKTFLVNLGFEAPGAMSKMTDQIFLF